MTVVHEHTLNPAEATRKADIVVSATGVAQLVRGHWLKKGAVVLDVGTSAVAVCSFLHILRASTSIAPPFHVTRAVSIPRFFFELK